MDARREPAKTQVPDPKLTSLSQPGASESELVCPNCSESRPQQLLWTSIDHVRCKSCDTVFTAWLNRDD